MIKRYFISFFLLIIFFWGCNSFKKKEAVDPKLFHGGTISIKDARFVDANGRQIILNGINYISKSAAENYMPQDNEELFKQFSAWGFNCIRFGIIWAGLEPEPGKYNEAYLQEIDKRIEWAEKNGIYVYLDMHQDLYGSKFSDGAPEWATLDEGKQHLTGAVWSDSYLISPAVQTAFDNFWKNTPAADGIGIQDHYANLWKHIAARYANNPAIIGYDIMNEPFMGSGANDILPVMLGAYARILAEETGKILTVEEVGAIWANEETRMEALKFMESKERYSKIVDSVYELNAAFEKNELQAMYQKVASAIREVDKNHILFLNHSYFSNTGVASAIEPVKLADGTTDPLVAYAAHGYDLVVDTKEIANPGFERVEFIFDRIKQTGERMNVPVMVGEWGAFNGKTSKLVPVAKHLLGIFEKYKFSNTYWAYYQGIMDEPYFNLSIIRPFPEYISGNLVQYAFDAETREFVCSWEESESIKSPTVIFVPNLKLLKDDEIKMDTSAEQIIFDYCDNSSAGKLMIPPLGKKAIRTVRFRIPEKADEISIQ